MHPRMFLLVLVIAVITNLLAGCNLTIPAAVPPATPTPSIVSPRAVGDVPFSQAEWRSDFSKHSVPWSEIFAGGPGKDGIPAIDAPEFDNVWDAQRWLPKQEPVIFFQQGNDARAYPLRILIWHEIVNDVVDGKPVTVTFCPLCNASIVFDRTLAGRVLDFGTTGKLRNSDLIMYDRQTESWWQQFTGEAIVGEYTGQQLPFLASQVIRFGDFFTLFSTGKVLKAPPLNRNYGQNPYQFYDSTVDRPFLYTGELDARLPATERVVGVAVGGTVMAYPFSAVAQAGAINDTLAGLPLVIFHKPGTVSALDSTQISEGKDVGSVAVYDRRLQDSSGERTVTFTALGNGGFQDTETGSKWNLLGQCYEGDLLGQQLTRVLSFDHFWFAWHAFYPQTALYGSN